MTIVGAAVRLAGLKNSYTVDSALVDTGARMTLIDRSLAEHLGVVYTGRKLSFVPALGHRVEAVEAIVPELILEGEALKYEAVAVTEIPGGKGSTREERAGRATNRRPSNPREGWNEAKPCEGEAREG